MIAVEITMTSGRVVRVNLPYANMQALGCAQARRTPLVGTLLEPDEAGVCRVIIIDPTKILLIVELD